MPPFPFFRRVNRAPNNARRDLLTSWYVDQAVARQLREGINGTLQAAMILANNDVPLEVARRVLSRCAHRRRHVAAN